MDRVVYPSFGAVGRAKQRKAQGAIALDQKRFRWSLDCIFANVFDGNTREVLGITGPNRSQDPLHISTRNVATKYIEDVNHPRTGCKRKGVCTRGACVNGTILTTVHGGGRLKVRQS